MAINSKNEKKFKKVWLYTAFGFNQSDIESLTGITRKTIAKWQKEITKINQVSPSNLVFDWDYPLLPCAYSFPTFYEISIKAIVKKPILNFFDNNLRFRDLYIAPSNSPVIDKRKFIGEPLFIALDIYNFTNQDLSLLQIKKRLCDTVKSANRDRPLGSDNFNRFEELALNLFELESRAHLIFFTSIWICLYTGNRTEFKRQIAQNDSNFNEDKLHDFLSMTMTKDDFEDYLNVLCDKAIHVLELIKSYFHIPDITFKLELTENRQGIK